LQFHSKIASMSGAARGIVQVNVHGLVITFSVLSMSSFNSCAHDHPGAPEVKLEAPSNLLAVPVSASQVELTWRDNSTSEMGFRIERRVNTAVDELIETGANVTRFRDTRLNPNAMYTYRVFAFNETEVSNPSNSITATTFRNNGPWIEQASGTDVNLAGVALTDEFTSIVVGLDGTILRTSDSGESWISRSSGTINALLDVFFLNKDFGITVGGWFPDGFAVILRTLNGGMNWIDQPTTLQQNLWGASFTDEKSGTVVGSAGTILQTANGGSNWNVQSSPTGNELFGVDFFDDNKGIAVGALGVIITTGNGGGVWRIQSSNAVEELHDVCFADSNLVLAVGNNGTILRSSDGGMTWAKQTSGIVENLFAVSCISPAVAIAVGQNGIILKTRDGGNTWERQPSGTSNTLLGVHFLDSNIGAAVGEYGTILRTTTGGE
jgi:photosystem II stability/assembly factor-like uncharacterized protein